MKKILMILLLMAGLSYAGDQKIKSYIPVVRGFTVTIDSVDTVITSPTSIGGYHFFGLQFKADSGTVAIDSIRARTSLVKDSSTFTPATNAAGNNTWTKIFGAITDTLWHQTDFKPPPTSFIIFEIYGGATTDSSLGGRLLLGLYP